MFDHQQESLVDFITESICLEIQRQRRALIDEAITVLRIKRAPGETVDDFQCRAAKLVHAMVPHNAAARRYADELTNLGAE